MRLSRLLPCVVVGGLIGVSVFGQSENEPVPPTEPFPSGDFEEAAESPATIDREGQSTAEGVAAEERELRKQYLKLIEQKTGLMDRSELREAISRTERDIDELKAAEKLLEARRLLLDLVKSHPETNAARAARAMLQAAPDGVGKGPFYHGDRLVPTPQRHDQPFDPPGTVGSFPQSIVPRQPVFAPPSEPDPGEGTILPRRR